MNKLAFFVLFSFSAIAFAEKGSAQLENEYSKCGELMSYRLLAGCFSNLETNANTILIKEYQSLVDYLEKKDRDRLEIAQSIWFKFREADCHFLSPSSDIEINSTITTKKICSIKRAINRIKELEDFNERRGCNGCEW